MVLLGGLERTPTFLVPIINPPFADNSPQLFLLKLLVFQALEKEKRGLIWI